VSAKKQCDSANIQLAKHVTYTLFINASASTEISVKIAESCSNMSMKGVGAIVGGVIGAFFVCFSILGFLVDRLRLNFENFVADNKTPPDYYPLMVIQSNEDDRSI
jgi:hypothetical protein